MAIDSKILKAFKTSPAVDIGIITALAIFSCSRTIFQNMRPVMAEDRTLYSLRIDDPEEAIVLEQEMKLEVLKLEARNLYFYSPTEGLLDSLQIIGYKVARAIARDHEFRFVKIRKSITEEELSDLNIQLINREEDYYIIRANLAQIGKLQEKNKDIEPLTEELRPREIVVLVDKQEDIKALSGFGIEIYGTKRKEGCYLINVGAFDYQIDELRKTHYSIVVKK